MSHEKTQTKITLDAAKAQWLLKEIQPFIADRPLSVAHVAKLASEMRQGHFIPEITTIMVANLEGTTYRLNGQHTATAVLEMIEEDSSFTLPGVTLLTFEVTDQAELRKLYARIDRGASRTNRDVTLSILAGTPDFADVSVRVLKLLPGGLAFAKFDDTNKRLVYSGETAALDVQGEFLELSQHIGKFMGSLDYTALHHGHMFRVPVVAALYETFAVDLDDAEAFWRAVATGVGFESETEPAARLRQTLKSVRIGGGTTGRGQAALSSEEMFRVCLHTWNRFRDSDKFQQALRPTTLKSRPRAK